MTDDRIRWDEKPVRLGKKGFVTWKTAMNELNKRIGLLKDFSNTVANKESVVKAINSVSDRIGLLRNLKTKVKDNIVAAINNVYDFANNTGEWLGDKSDVSEETLTHGDTVSKLIEYLSNKTPDLPVQVGSFGVSDPITLAAGATHDIDYSWWLSNGTYAVVGVSYHLPSSFTSAGKLMAFPTENGVRLYNFGTTPITITTTDNFSVNMIAAKIV